MRLVGRGHGGGNTVVPLSEIEPAEMTAAGERLKRPVSLSDTVV